MLSFRSTTAADTVAAALLDGYFGERVEIWQGEGTSYVPKPADFSHGALLVAERDGVAVGVGGIRPVAGQGMEVKHLYVTPEARGSGLGRALLRELERRAVSLGAHRMVLDTNRDLDSANHLYRAEGYLAVEPFNDNANATDWFAKDLPATWVLVHGACTYPSIFDAWHADLEAIGAAQILAPDLQADADPATLTTAGQAARVRAALDAADHPVVLVGWSMGGLVSMTLADHPAIVGLILLEPSVPAPLLPAGRAVVEPRPGLLDHDATYGPATDAHPRRPESSPARDERKNGIDVPAPAEGTRTMVVWGPQYPERGRPVAELIGAQQLELPGASHLDMVIDPESRAAILRAWAPSATRPE